MTERVANKQTNDMKHILYTLAALLMLAASAHAQNDSKWEQWGPTTGLRGGGFIVRAGYVIGGTMPLPLPAELRKINSFSPKGGLSLGIDGYRMFSKRWGASVGAHFFWEGFSTSADVKNYYVWLEQEGEVTKGYFTGCNETSTQMWGVTLPVLATFRISPRWNVSMGPFMTCYFKQTFDGKVYDNNDGVGYLRVDTPTGDKVKMTREDPTPYPDDFADHMLPLSGGIELAFDWKAMRHMNVFGKVDWGLSNIWSSNYQAISFPMYPIYGTIGMAYSY